MGSEKVTFSLIYGKIVKKMTMIVMRFFLRDIFSEVSILNLLFSALVFHWINAKSKSFASHMLCGYSSRKNSCVLELR